MKQALVDRLWERAQERQHTLLLGSGQVPWLVAPGLNVVRVRCDGPWTTWGPLYEARMKLRRLLGIQRPNEEAWDRVAATLRTRVLGSLHEPRAEAGFVELCNRVAAEIAGPVALVFDAVDVGDEATRTALMDVLSRRGWLRLPVLMSAVDPETPEAQALTRGMKDAYGERAVIRAAREEDGASDFVWHDLPYDILRVLRAGAAIGTTFEADLVARLLDMPVGLVLEELQQAADLGAPLADRSEGRFSLPRTVAESMVERLLPSLLEHWHRRIALLVGGEEPYEDEPWPDADDGFEVSPMPPESELPTGVEAHPEIADHAAPDEELAELLEPLGSADSDADRYEVPVLIRGGDGDTLVEGRPRSASDEPRPMPARRRGALGADDARAGHHLHAVGEVGAAVERYLEAAHDLAEQGDARRGYLLAREALEMLDESPRDSELRARVLMELGRLQWHGAGLGSAFTLHGALESLEAARVSLGDEPQPELAAELSSLVAGVCYDLGDLDSLQRGLDELVRTSRTLIESGRSTHAARLFNDQAAVYVRLGDPVRAAHLLGRTRDLFRELLAADPDDRPSQEELAETEHLLARLPLHARARPGREHDAVAAALRHARSAERTYRELSRAFELGRLWETAGRLELARGNLDRSAEHLRAALEVQDTLGDITGLARSTAALSDVLLAAGRPDEAMVLLADSVALNIEKGSPIGLAFNRRALAALGEALGRSPDRALLEDLQELEKRLESGESVLGQLTLPEGLGGVRAPR